MEDLYLFGTGPDMDEIPIPCAQGVGEDDEEVWAPPDETERARTLALALWMSAGGCPLELSVSWRHTSECWEGMIDSSAPCSCHRMSLDVHWDPLAAVRRRQITFALATELLDLVKPEREQQIVISPVFLLDDHGTVKDKRPLGLWVYLFRPDTRKEEP